jgi:aminoglycoside phosphotransferase (APT) family kinase protein
MKQADYAGITATLFPGAKLNAVVPLAGGVSADVHRLDLDLADGSTTNVVVRAHGASHSGHTAELEYRLLESLYQGGVPVPEPLLVDVSGTLLADPFLVMAFVSGTSAVPAGQEGEHIDAMANVLAGIHALPTANLPPLPARNDPLPEVLDFLPEGAEWQGLQVYLRSLTDTTYAGSPRLLHGDFWPENLLWQNGAVVAILDWEDAALGDPLSDVACCRLELRYKFGVAGMERFTRAYARHGAGKILMGHTIRRRLLRHRARCSAATRRVIDRWNHRAIRPAEHEVSAVLHYEVAALVQQTVVEAAHADDVVQVRRPAIGPVLTVVAFPVPRVGAAGEAAVAVAALHRAPQGR